MGRLAEEVSWVGASIGHVRGWAKRGESWCLIETRLAQVVNGAFIRIVAVTFLQGALMSTKQMLMSCASMHLPLLVSPCSTQIILQLDAAGYVRPVVIPQRTTFSMGMQASAVVSPNLMSIRVNATPFGLSMPDPAATTFLVVPGPNLGIFDGGRPQPATIALKPIVIPIQGQVGFGQFGFGQGFGMSPFGFGGPGFMGSQFNFGTSGFFAMSMR